MVDHIPVPIGDERNLLEVIRKANIELPTFCYHSEMSIYGACRLCLVEIEGRGLQPACSTLPEEGLVISTNTQQIRAMRRMILELMLANHQGDCPTCVKGGDCQLQQLAHRMGVAKIRFSRVKERLRIDASSPAIIHDPNKCILCGDCVRTCNEIQGVGAIDFAYSGSEFAVAPCFGKNMAQGECVACGQCSLVCPTGALYARPSINEVWAALHDPAKTVVAQIDPAVRIALGEDFNLAAGTIATGQIVSALRRMGFDFVYDTAFAADLMTIELGEEFLERLEKGERLPIITSCCPAWVTFAEQHYPEYLDNLSTCRSPHQMLGALVKNKVTPAKGVKPEDIVVVSIMPCIAKKGEVLRPEFSTGYGRDVDYVLTTLGLSLMIKEAGLNFNQLGQDSFDMPFGFITGAGVIHGNSGGVTEAVARYVSEKVSEKRSDYYVYSNMRNGAELREIKVTLGKNKLNLAVASGLGSVKKLIKKMKKGQAHYDFIEVKACPGGCINGGGQPPGKEKNIKAKRSAGLYDNDKMLQLHKSRENPYIADLYERFLEKPGSQIARKLLHTHYQSKKRVYFDMNNLARQESKQAKLELSICFGTSCLVKGAQGIYSGINQYLNENKSLDKVQINTTFCYEKCSRGPVIRIGEEVIEACTLEIALEEIGRQLK